MSLELTLFVISYSCGEATLIEGEAVFVGCNVGRFLCNDGATNFAHQFILF